MEEDRSAEELAEEEALAKRLKLAFKAAKVNAAKKKEAKAKLVTACISCSALFQTYLLLCHSNSAPLFPHTDS